MPEIWVPDTVRSYKCEVPGCEETFLDKGRFLRHVPTCARKRRPALIDISEAHQAEVESNPFLKVHDPEALDWIQGKRSEKAPGYER